MTRVFIADSYPDTRAALRLMLRGLEMQVVGEADDWQTTMAQASSTEPDMLLVDWNLVPADSSLAVLRATCSEVVVIVLVSYLDARRQAALSAGADSFISKGDTPDRVAQRLREAANGNNHHFPFSGQPL